MKPVAWRIKVQDPDDEDNWSWQYHQVEGEGQPLYTADQLREAQVKVLREAADAISKGMAPNKAREMIRRMADELEKQK